MDEFDQMIAEFIEGKRKNAQDPDILDRSKVIGDISEMIKEIFKQVHHIPLRLLEKRLL